jgi:hypothetical protein
VICISFFQVAFGDLARRNTEFYREDDFIDYGHLASAYCICTLEILRGSFDIRMPAGDAGIKEGDCRALLDKLWSWVHTDMGLH